VVTGITDRELTNRWKSRDREQLVEEVFSRLRGGKPLADLGLGEHQGRIDLRGIPAPRPEVLNASSKAGWVVQEMGGLLKFEDVRLEDLDLSHAHLEGFRLTRAAISNCRFDQAGCQNWRLWACDVTASTFIGTDLRKAVLGAWHEGRGSIYRKVDFSGANLRLIVCPAATFVDCDFGNAQLAKVDFQSSSFVRCRFAGLLREVMFYDHGFKTGKPDANQMEDVDFSEAELRMVEFRHLDLDRVQFPKDDAHLIVKEYRCVLQRALDELKDNAQWRGFRAVLEHRLKWAGPHQATGVFNLRDLAEGGGEAEVQFARELLDRLEMTCSGT
jgi:uncharacterized protein YjbI with pentapeptide repeats